MEEGISYSLADHCGLTRYAKSFPEGAEVRLWIVGVMVGVVRAG